MLPVSTASERALDEWARASTSGRRGKRCNRRAIEGGFCAQHQPGARRRCPRRPRIGESSPSWRLLGGALAVAGRSRSRNHSLAALIAQLRRVRAPKISTREIAFPGRMSSHVETTGRQDRHRSRRVEQMEHRLCHRAGVCARRRHAAAHLSKRAGQADGRGTRPRTRRRGIFPLRRAAAIRHRPAGRSAQGRGPQARRRRAQPGLRESRGLEPAFLEHFARRIPAGPRRERLFPGGASPRRSRR